MDHRILAQLQHAVQYPAAHLDRRVSFAIGGPAFEMPGDSTRMAQPIEPTQPAAEPTADTPGQPAEVTITAVDHMRRFITAGRAIFTLQGKDSRYTYRVNRKDPVCSTCKHEVPEGSRKCPACDAITNYPASTVYFVSLLTGPNNLDDYTYCGLLMVHDGTIRLTRSSKYREDSKPVQAFNWAMRRIWQGKPIDPAVFYHIGRCARCGRALTVPSSIETGLGPECAGKV